MQTQNDGGMSVGRMVEELNADVDRAHATMQATNSQYDRRAFVRAVFVAVEAASYLMRHQCLALVERGAREYTPEEIVLLREESYNLDHRGQISSQQKYLPTDVGFRFSLELFMRTTFPSFRLDAGGSQWQDFRKGVKIRHRLTHPKGIEDLTVGDEDLDMVLTGYKWFLVTMHKALDYVATAHLKKTEAGMVLLKENPFPRPEAK